jgi:hypothetical protein
MDRHDIWRKWIAVLQAWGVSDLAATLLEATGPLNFIGGQAVYLGQPVLNLLFSKEKVSAFADLLDNPAEVEFFVKTLRQQSQDIEHQKCLEP